MRLQITDYILKPVDYEEFGNTIDHLKISIFEKQTKDVTPGSEASTIVGIVRYMQEHLAEEISLNVLAETFHLSAQYISQLFKNEIGVNFLAYLTTIRMECAKKLLVSTQLSIAEISERCGYADYRCLPRYSRRRRAVHRRSIAEIFCRSFSIRFSMEPISYKAWMKGALSYNLPVHDKIRLTNGCR